MQVPNAPRRRARAGDWYYEENIMESYFHPEARLGITNYVVTFFRRYLRNYDVIVFFRKAIVLFFLFFFSRPPRGKLTLTQQR